MTGPDLYTLRAWAEVNLALDRGVTIDAAHALITDAADAAFGPRLYDWVSEALTGEGRDPDDLAALIADADLADRVLDRLRERMGEDDEAPDPPDPDLGWSAYEPGDPAGGREAFRRAVRNRARTIRWASISPPRRRVAGTRDR